MLYAIFAYHTKGPAGRQRQLIADGGKRMGELRKGSLKHASGRGSAHGVAELARQRRERRKARRRLQARFNRPVWRITLGVVALAIILLGRFVEEVSFDLAPESRFDVTKVIDGDTVELSGGDRLRLLFIDSPERGQPFYDSALALLDSLTINKRASLIFGRRQRDGYGRLLAVVEAGNVNVNQRLLERGFANIYLFKDNLKDTLLADQLQLMLEAQRKAIHNRVGLLSLERLPEDYYLSSHSSLRFHRPGCRSVAGRQHTALDRYAAREEPLVKGLSPCRNCRP